MEKGDIRNKNGTSALRVSASRQRLKFFNFPPVLFVCGGRFRNHWVLPLLSGKRRLMFSAAVTVTSSIRRKGRCSLGLMSFPITLMCIKSKGSRKMHTQRLKRETSKGKRRGKQTQMRWKFMTSCFLRPGAEVRGAWSSLSIRARLAHGPGASGGKRGRGDAGQCVCAVNSIKRFIHQRTRTHRGPMANTNTRAAGFNPLSAGWAKLRA